MTKPAHRAIPSLILGLLLTLTALAQDEPSPAERLPADRQGDGGWGLLEQIDAALIDLAKPVDDQGLPAWSQAAVAARAEAIAGQRGRLEAIDPAQWSVGGKVDYLLVRARLSGLEFEHRVLRPWARDPIFWLEQVERVPYVSLPLSGEEAARWRTELASVPEILQQARGLLTEASGELADLAVFHLDARLSAGLCCRHRIPRLAAHPA
jgi:hypothetical protein